MRLLRRILVTAVVTLTVIFVFIYWIGPVALSFYAVRKAPAVFKVVPVDLKDFSVSQAPGTKLSYLGHDFEVPWTDLDDSKTVLYPKDKPEKTRVVLTFRSGLRVMVTSIRPREYADGFATDFKMPARSFESVFGPGTATSDYVFAKNIYEFTPASMHYWSLSTTVHYREQAHLIIKSMMLVLEADTGIFRVQNIDYKGFQQGDPNVRTGRILVNLYSDAGEIEIAFLLKDYHSMPLKQSEINRVIQSLKAYTTVPAAPQVAKR